MQRLLQALRILPYATHRTHFIELELVRVCSYLKAGEFALAEDQLVGMPAETYEHLVWRLSRERHASRWLNDWSLALPLSSHPRLILAYVDVSNAWAVRGETYAKDIPLLRRRRYPQIMQQAFEKFTRIVEEDPCNAMALAGLIHCNVVIGSGDGNRDRWLNDAMEAEPFHCPAITQYARGTWERWGGEVDEHFRFADWVVVNAPVGSCSHVVAAQAVLDDALTVSEEIYDIRHIARHLGNAEVAEWLRRALLKWADATPDVLERRVAEIIATQGDSYHGVCLESFALAAYFSGAKEEARLLFGALRGRLQADIWDSFIPPMPMWLYVISSKQRGMHRVHDRICRDLGLDPCKVCHG